MPISINTKYETKDGLVPRSKTICKSAKKCRNLKKLDQINKSQETDTFNCSWHTVLKMSEPRYC